MLFKKKSSMCSGGVPHGMLDPLIAARWEAYSKTPHPSNLNPNRRRAVVAQFLSKRLQLRRTRTRNCVLVYMGHNDPRGFPTVLPHVVVQYWHSDPALLTLSSQPVVRKFSPDFPRLPEPVLNFSLGVVLRHRLRVDASLVN